MKKDIIKVKFLGTGANGGLPQVDCRCKNCKNSVFSRRRSSLLIESNDKKLIVDCGPDFHSQLINSKLRLQDISGFVISHLHWDHCMGLFELSSGKKLNMPVFVHNKIKKILMHNDSFKFIFQDNWATLSKIKGFDIKFVEIEHAPNFPTFAIKISVGNKSITYCSDIFKFNKNLIKEIAKSNLVIFDGTFLDESKHFHLSIKESVPVLMRLNKNIIYTHINHSENTRVILDYLKNHKMRLAFDGMSIKV
ncbi:MAG: MBL fold metallo-hydrolase [bacterium]|nr:MBL fold metallo-hydrolase [bacterium]